MAQAAPKTQRKLTFASFSPTWKVAVLGDSLTGGPAGKWRDLLFDSTYTADGCWLGDHFTYDPSNSNYFHYGAGGTDPHDVLAFLAESSGGLVSPFEDREYDLAFVLTGVNGGQEPSWMVEHAVRRLRRWGIDVVLISPNPGSGDLTGRDGFAADLQSIADRYRCVHADVTQAFKDEVAGGTALGDLLSDAVHPNEAGHLVYAKTIRDALLADAAESPTVAPYWPTVPVITPDDSSWGTEFVRHRMVAAGSTTGTATADTFAQRHPRYQRPDEPDTVWTLASGETATFTVPSGTVSVDVLADFTNAATVDVDDGTTTNTVTWSAVSQMQVAAPQTAPSDWPGGVGTTVTLTCTSGTAEVHGLLAHYR